MKMKMPMPSPEEILQEWKEMGEDSGQKPLPFYFACIGSGAHAYWEYHLSKLGIHRGCHHFLIVIGNHPGITQTELTKLVNVDKALTARVIKRLSKKGLVIKKKDPVDRRKNRIYLDSKLKKHRKKIKVIREKWIKSLMKGLTEGERKAFYNILEKISKNALEIKRTIQNKASKEK